MRRLLAPLVAGTLLASIAGTALAAFDVEIASGGITVECFTTEDLSQVVISGEVTVVSGTADFGLELRGHTPGDMSSEFNTLIDSLVIDNSGPGTYPYTFTVDASSLDAFNSLRVEAVSIGGATVNPEKSRSFLDECRTVIPEAPVLGLFLLTAGVTTGIVLWRRRSSASVMAA